MTTSWSRSPLRPVRFSGDNVKTLHKISKCCQCRGQSIIICLRLKDCRNPPFECAVLLISFTEEVSCILPSRLSQFVELHLLLPKALHPLLYRLGDCAHHPPWLVIIAQHAVHSLFIILVIPIFPIVATRKITQTVSNSNQHLLKRLLGQGWYVYSS
jgi:hypothetical protein